MLIYNVASNNMTNCPKEYGSCTTINSILVILIPREYVTQLFVLCSIIAICGHHKYSYMITILDNTIVNACIIVIYEKSIIYKPQFS